MIPSDWEVKKIGELTNVLTGFPFPGNTILENGNVRLLRGVNITEGQIRHSDDIDRFYSGNIESLREYALREDDLVIGMDGSKVGKNSAIIHKNESGNLLVQRVARLRVKNSKQPISYLFYFISSNNFIAYIDSLKTNSAIPHISPADIRNYTIPLPSKIEEQQRIANALSDVDTLIANLEKLIAKKKNIKQGAMQQLLTGKKRLPGFAPDERTGSRPTDERRKACHSERSAKREVEESSGYKMTELGLIPSDWEETYLGNIGPVKMCKRVMKYQTSEKGDIPFYKIGTFGKSPDAYISKDLYHYLKNKYSFPQKGTVLISAAGTIGRTVVYDGKDAFFQDSNIVWLENDESVLTNQYLYYLYQVVEWKTENGGAVSRLYNDNFKITPIAIPSSKAEQTAIANVLSDVDTEISALETKLAKYRTLKTGMMQQLLTGKIRLL